MLDLVERLKNFTVNTVSGCHEWQGARDVAGYGRIGHNSKVYQVHRITWEQTKGSIPEGMKVLHSCDNPPCKNIDHLFLGTQKDNVTDMMVKGRHRKAKSFKHPMPVIEQAIKEWCQGCESLKVIAQKHGMTRSGLGYYVYTKGMGKF